jgi:hypothetical protein
VELYLHSPNTPSWCGAWLSTGTTLPSPLYIYIYISKVKVKLSVGLAKHYAIKAYWEWRYISTHSLASELDTGEWSASRPGRFTPMKRTHSTLRIGGWVGPRSILETAVKGKIPSPRRESNLRTPIVTHGIF